MIIDIEPKCKEGYEQIVLTMPYDGDENDPSFFMLGALKYACALSTTAEEYFRALQCKQQKEKKRVANA